MPKKETASVANAAPETSVYEEKYWKKMLFLLALRTPIHSTPRQLSTLNLRATHKAGFSVPAIDISRLIFVYRTILMRPVLRTGCDIARVPHPCAHQLFGVVPDTFEHRASTSLPGCSGCTFARYKSSA